MKTLHYNLYKTLAVFGLLLLFIAAKAQPVNFMVMSKPGNSKRYTFYEGDLITYKLKTDITFFTDRVVKIKDSVITFATYDVPYESIEKIFITKKKHLFISNKAVAQYGISIVAGSALLEAAYLVNTGKGMPTIVRDMTYVLSPVPVFLLMN
jgi:hypothetical protein